MTSLPDRQQAVVLIEEAQSNGARLTKACALLNLSMRTYQRWSFDSAVSADRRPLVTM
jgi:putative transposase